MNVNYFEYYPKCFKDIMLLKLKIALSYADVLSEEKMMEASCIL